MLKEIIKGCKPTIGSEFSGCVDLYSSEEITVGMGETKTIGLGVKICIDKQSLDMFAGGRGITRDKDMDEDSYYLGIKKLLMSNHFMSLMARSSLGVKGLIIPNGIGVIDLDYPGEIKMIIQNPITIKSALKYVFSFGRNKSEYKISKFDKIAQATILQHATYLFGVSTKKSRTGGFGSTGK